MAEITSSETRPPASKRRKVSGSRNRAQEMKRSKSWKGGRHTVGGEKPQPKSKKVTVGGSKKRLRQLVKVGSLLKKANVAGYIISDLMKSHGLSEKEWKEGPGTLAYARKQERK